MAGAAPPPRPGRSQAARRLGGNAFCNVNPFFALLPPMTMQFSLLREIALPPHRGAHPVRDPGNLARFQPCRQPHNGAVFLCDISLMPKQYLYLATSRSWPVGRLAGPPFPAHQESGMTIHHGKIFLFRIFRARLACTAPRRVRSTGRRAPRAGRREDLGGPDNSGLHERVESLRHLFAASHLQKDVYWRMVGTDPSLYPPIWISSGIRDRFGPTGIGCLGRAASAEPVSFGPPVRQRPPGPSPARERPVCHRRDAARTSAARRRTSPLGDRAHRAHRAHDRHDGHTTEPCPEYRMRARWAFDPGAPLPSIGARDRHQTPKP